MAFVPARRQLLDQLIYLIAFPRLPFTRIMPAGRYAASRPRNPGRLQDACRRAGAPVVTYFAVATKSL